MSRSFSDRLRDEADDLWRAQVAHPFIRGIADGSLDPARFRHYVRQDYLFLVDYGRLLALASARSPRLDWQRRFAEVALETLAGEMDLHRAYAADWGISAHELAVEPPTATTCAYTDFLLRTATLGSYAELVGALLPCIWGYSWLGRELAAEPPVEGSPYGSWIEMYASEDFAALSAWCRDVFDSVTEGFSEEAFRGVRDVFIAASRHELAFWDASWRLEPAVVTSAV